MLKIVFVLGCLLSLTLANPVSVTKTGSIPFNPFVPNTLTPQLLQLLLNALLRLPVTAQSKVTRDQQVCEKKKKTCLLTDY
uniref:Uncharacterized protein n=1 Tax=Echeneis naucrates TaxID=173247 RepID=A0A665TLG9_ECHNA